MNGTLKRLLAALLAASTLMLGACVAQTDDEEEQTIETHAADTFVPTIPKDPGGHTGGVSPSALPAPPLPATNDPGAPCKDPEPSPWQPPTTNH